MAIRNWQQYIASEKSQLERMQEESKRSAENLQGITEMALTTSAYLRQRSKDRIQKNDLINFGKTFEGEFTTALEYNEDNEVFIGSVKTNDGDTKYFKVTPDVLDSVRTLSIGRNEDPLDTFVTKDENGDIIGINQIFEMGLNQSHEAVRNIQGQDYAVTLDEALLIDTVPNYGDLLLNNIKIEYGIDLSKEKPKWNKDTKEWEYSPKEQVDLHGNPIVPLIDDPRPFRSFVGKQIPALQNAQNSQYPVPQNFGQQFIQNVGQGMDWVGANFGEGSKVGNVIEKIGSEVANVPAEIQAVMDIVTSFGKASKVKKQQKKIRENISALGQTKDIMGLELHDALDKLQENYHSGTQELQRSIAGTYDNLSGTVQRGIKATKGLDVGAIGTMRETGTDTIMQTADLSLDQLDKQLDANREAIGSEFREETDSINATLKDLQQQLVASRGMDDWYENITSNIVSAAF